MKPYLNSREACKYLGIKKLGTLYGYVKLGKLEAYKLGGNHNNRRHWRFTKKDLDNFVKGVSTGQAGTRGAKQRQCCPIRSASLTLLDKRKK